MMFFRENVEIINALRVFLGRLPTVTAANSEQSAWAIYLTHLDL